MSRNLCRTDCVICDGKDIDIVLEESARPITKNEAGPYFTEYRDMLVANAHCRRCEAKYLAWIADAPTKSWRRDARSPGHVPPFIDLSFRSSFNDEPGPDDLPTPERLRAIHRAERRAFAAAERREADSAEREIAAKRDLAARLEDEAENGESFWETYRRLGKTDAP